MKLKDWLLANDPHDPVEEPEDFGEPEFMEEDVEFMENDAQELIF